MDGATQAIRCSRRPFCCCWDRVAGQMVRKNASLRVLLMTILTGVLLRTPPSLRGSTAYPTYYPSSSSSSSSPTLPPRQKGVVPSSLVVEALAMAAVVIQSRCACGQVVLDIPLNKEGDYLDASSSSAHQVFNCHCPGCRKYHMAAHSSVLQLMQTDQLSVRHGSDQIVKYRHRQDEDENLVCPELGPNVERWHCRTCSSKLLSIPTTTTSSSSLSTPSSSSFAWINMGPLDEASIPNHLTSQWGNQLMHPDHNLHTDTKSLWVDALPAINTTHGTSAGVPSHQHPTTWTGGCSCGTCRYELILTQPTEFQHCYCHLCRQVSGAAYMTWIPVHKTKFRWLCKPSEGGSDGPGLIRTTPFGCRHICPTCRGVLTIVYDDQPDYVWPCAGGLDDSSLSSFKDGDMSRYLSRVCHICCRHHPSWLTIREDGMERILDAC